MTRPLTPDQLDQWVLAYLDGEIDADAFAQLTEALRTDPAALDRFVELAMLDRAAQDTLTHGEQVQTLHQGNHERAEPALSFEAMLKLLGRGSEHAQLVHMDAQSDPLRRARPYLIGGAIAAVLMLAVTLTFVFSGKPTPQGPRFSSDTAPTPATAVATLTSQHNASWAEGAFASGSDLQSGQKLTLTQGTATLTTHKGAVATLFAPCTVQLLDDNALRLTRGRLSGRVDTQRAEGFAVHLPTGDRIVDLGTAFTVAVDDAGRSDVRVTEGLVAWVPKPSAADNTPAKPLLIAANQSAALVAGRPVLYRAQHLLSIDFQHTGAPSPDSPQPMVGVTQEGFEAFDQTRVADNNRATFATDAGEITVVLAGLDRLQHNGYFTRPPARDSFAGFDLYNDHIFENIDGRFTLTLTGPGIAPGQSYDLTFYAYDPGDGTLDSLHGSTQGVAFTGIDGTAGRANSITYTVGTHPARLEQYKSTAAFTADAQGRITVEVTDAYEDDQYHIRLNAIEIARRVATNNDTNS